MNKIVFLKVLICVITFLIFLTLGGIVYGLVNYKTTPKLLSGKTGTAAAVRRKTAGTPQEIHLNLTDGEHIKDSHACGNMLCLRISSDFDGERVVIFDPSGLQIKATVFGTKKQAGE